MSGLTPDQQRALSACQAICIILAEDVFARIDGVGDVTQDEWMEDKRAELSFWLKQLKEPV